MFEEDNAHQSHQAFIVHQHAQQQREMQHWHEMQMIEIKTSMDSFLDSLTAEQCLSLSRMTQLFIANPTYPQVVIGQLSVMLRLVHKVCATCGDTKHSTVEHLTAQQPVPDQIDFSWLAGLSPSEQIKKLNLEENPASKGMYTCRNCGTHYMTLFDRAVRGKYCTDCIARAIELSPMRDEELLQVDLMIRYEVAESFTIEDGVFCLKCDTEFPTMKHRMEQGELCPVCKIQPEVERNESPTETI